MNQQHHQDYEPSPRRLYRDRDRGRLFGVCAGIADYFGIKTCFVRILTIIAGCVWFPIAEIVYIALGFTLPEKPRDLYKDQKEETFWRSVRKSPADTFSDVRYRFRQLDQRMQKMERYVTSSRFRLDREFRDLENE